MQWPWALVLAAVVFAALAVASACGDDGNDGTADAGDTGASEEPHDDVAATVGDISILSPAARATVNEVTAVYFIIHNHGEADRLISAASDVTANVQLHEVVMQDGSMQMRQVESGIDVPANSDVELKPGGYHVMLLDLAAPLELGDEIQMELTFERAGSVSFAVPVSLAPGESPGMADDAGDHSMDSNMGDDSE